MIEGDFYPKYKLSNYISNQFNLNVGYQDSYKKISISPFADVIFNNRHSQIGYGASIVGFDTKVDYKISSKLKLSSGYNFRYILYDNINKELNNYIHKFNVALFFEPKSNSLLRSNVFYEESFFKPIFNAKGYRTFGLSLSWNNVWRKYLGTQMFIEYQKIHHKDLKMIFNKKEEKSILNLDMAIWNPRWSWKNITPKLHFSYRVVNSNIDIFSYKEPKVFIEVAKFF